MKSISDKIRPCMTGLFISLLLLITANQIYSQNGPAMLLQWGGFGSEPGEFKYPTMMVTDDSDHIFVVDQHNHRIQKFDADGNFILMWGRQGEGEGEFNYPFGISLDTENNIYVTDMNNHRVQKFSSQGDFMNQTGSYGSEQGEFKYPYGIAADKNNRLYVIDAFNYRIEVFDSDLTFLSEWGSESDIGIRLYMPHDIAVSEKNEVFLSDRQNHRVSVFTTEGDLIFRFGEFGEGISASGGQFSEPHGLAIDQEGNILVCDRYNFRFQIFDSEGTFKSLVISSGIMDDSKHFPMCITTDSKNNVYVSDHYSHHIQKYTTSFYKP